MSGTATTAVTQGRDMESALDSQDFEQAASLRDRERQLLAGKTARQHQWEAAHPDLVSLAEQVQRLSGERACFSCCWHARPAGRSRVPGITSMSLAGVAALAHRS